MIEQELLKPEITQSLTCEPMIMSPKSRKKPIQLTGLNNNDTEAELNKADMRVASQLENPLLAENDSAPDLREELVNVVLSREYLFKNVAK